jgi:hypothetical protein
MVPAMFERRIARRLARGLAFSATAIFAASASPAAAQTAPIVVELYTSQGCASCPPADSYFGELVSRPGILGLGFHVDYWNYLGWRDPYSSGKYTYRQKEYAMSFHQIGVYTPQMVIQGRRGEVGSDRNAVAGAIAAMRDIKPLAAVAIEKAGDRRLHAVITAEDGAKGAEIFLAVFDRSRSTSVPRGENEGRTITNYNIVRLWKKVGAIAGEKTELDLALPQDSRSSHSGAAVVVQQPRCGPIVGAAAIDLD